MSLWGALELLGEGARDLGGRVLSLADNPYLQGGLTIATGGAAAPWIAAYNERGSEILHSWVDPKTGAPVPAGTPNARPLTPEERAHISGTPFAPPDPADPFGNVAAVARLRAEQGQAEPSPVGKGGADVGGGAGALVVLGLLVVAVAVAKARS